MNRDQDLLAIRLELPITMATQKSPVENFMHETLRPILKFQNEPLIAIIKAASHYERLRLTPLEKKNSRDLLKVFLQKNNGLRNQLLGIIIGLFSSEELVHYFEMEKELNKRILEMTITRFISQL